MAPTLLFLGNTGAFCPFQVGPGAQWLVGKTAQLRSQGEARENWLDLGKDSSGVPLPQARVILLLQDQGIAEDSPGLPVSC